MQLLLVEDDVMVVSGIKLGLTNAGYAVAWVGGAPASPWCLRPDPRKPAGALCENEINLSPYEPCLTPNPPPP